MLKSCFYVLTLLTSINIISQNNTFCEQIEYLKILIEEYHYAPKPIDDSLSKGVHKLFLKNLDENQKFLISEDITHFKKEQYQLDDYINTNTCNFIDVYTNRLNKRILESKSYIEALKNETLDYLGKDTLYFDADLDYKYFKNVYKAKKYWSKRIRLNIVTKLIEDDTIFNNIKTNFKALERKVKPIIIENELCLLDELLNQNGGIEQFVKEAFLNAFLSYQDPHSTFLNNTTKNLFENSLANTQMSFGISTTKNDDGDITISYVTPGSPAFKNTNIEVNDVIKSIKSDDAILNTYCISNNDVILFLNDKTKLKATFKIKKPNGLIKTIELTKKRIDTENNNVTAYLIKNDKPIGYIKIPSFYTDFESPNGLGVANDVAKEIYKLKKENVSGLIIDLRFNGGGSMKEAIDFAGMFIDRGPVSILKYKNGETQTLKDYKRGTVFNKPLVILVNQFSASASELLASVLQDYNRAFVVGTKTHGKSSAQLIFPIHEDKDLGFAKLTIEKFYKPTGKSHQSKGVIPDIILPSLYDNFQTEEHYSAYALKNDSVQPAIKLIPNKAINISKLKTLSNKRTSTSTDFKNIRSINSKILKNYIHKKTQYPITLNAIYNDFTLNKTLWNDLKNITEKTSDTLVFENTISTNQIIAYNDSEKEDNKTLLSELAKDSTLNEAYRIIIDLINTNN